VNLNDEKKRIDELTTSSEYFHGIMFSVTQFSYSQLKPHLVDPILELGPADGVVTTAMVRDGFLPDLVEGSTLLAESLRVKFPDLNIANSLFEEFQPSSRYKTIVMGHILEHVENPIDLLVRYSKFLDSGGVIWAAVPNADSLHRRAAVKMRLLQSVYELNENDLLLGHRRVFDASSFRNIFVSAELRIVAEGGYFLKPLSNGQIEQDWTQEMLNAYLELGIEEPAHAAEMWILATK
jgi:trans-aconitate methyltransferase